MITTLTINPAIDKTVFVNGFKINDINRIKEFNTSIGGKGINVSKVIKELGGKTEAICVLGGSNGKLLQSELDTLGINNLPVWVEEETRINLKVVDTYNNTCTEINEDGPFISLLKLNEIKNVLKNCIGKSEYIVLGGKTPSNVSSTIYREIIEVINGRVKVVLDTSGELLKEGIKAKPYLIKPNIHELEELCQKKFNNLDEIISKCKQIIYDGVNNIYLTMGKDGILFVNPDIVIRAYAPKVEQISSIGAGDITLGTFLYTTLKGFSLNESIKYSVGAGTASVTLKGTDVPGKEIIEKYSKLVNIN